MAITYEQMPAQFQQRALEIFGQRMRDEIDDATRDRLIRENEAAAQAAIAGGGGGGQQPSGEMCNGQSKPTAALRRGWEYYCSSTGWDTRWTGPGAEPQTPEEERQRWEDEDNPNDPMQDPSRIPGDAPQGYVYEWDGERWVLKRDTEAIYQERARESAMDLMRQRLDAYGLGNLAQFVWNLITQENITSEFALVERIRETEQYKQRFPAMKLRRDRNLNAISEQDYINLENSYRETMKIAGMPVNLFDTPEDFTSLISGDVSPAELKARVNQGYAAVAQSNPQVIQEMKRLYGVDDSMLAAYFLDPERTTPMLLRQAQAAQIAGQATLQAEMAIAAATAEELAVAGVTEETARQGFQTIAATEELFVPLPGTTEAAIGAEEQIAGVFGTSAAAQQRIRQRSRERQAAFQAGGQFAGQGSTVTGLQ